MADDVLGDPYDVGYEVGYNSGYIHGYSQLDSDTKSINTISVYNFAISEVIAKVNEYDFDQKSELIATLLTMYKDQ